MKFKVGIKFCTTGSQKFPEIVPGVWVGSVEKFVRNKVLRKFSFIFDSQGKILEQFDSQFLTCSIESFFKKHKQNHKSDKITAVRLSTGLDKLKWLKTEDFTMSFPHSPHNGYGLCTTGTTTTTKSQF